MDVTDTAELATVTDTAEFATVIRGDTEYFHSTCTDLAPMTAKQALTIFLFLNYRFFEEY